MSEEKSWEEIKDIIFDIKKKREEIRRKRNYHHIEDMLAKELSESLTREINKEILKRLTELGNEDL